MRRFSVLMVILLVSASSCENHVWIYHDDYAFSFPMTIKDAKSLFSLNTEIWGSRIARVNGQGCKEVQITHIPDLKDSSYSSQVEAVSFYHKESMDFLKRSLERKYDNKFETVYYSQTDKPHYFLMHMGRLTVVLYPTNFRACINHELTPHEQLKLPEMLSVVAFTQLLTEANEFDAFVTLDGLWRE